ncbi:MAG: hypothetical protein ACYSWO_03035 [Planctomycetota bacterium]|jgi:hypothetical protein
MNYKVPIAISLALVLVGIAVLRQSPIVSEDSISEPESPADRVQTRLTAYAAAKHEAETALKNGQFGWKRYGLRGLRDFEMKDILKAEYDVILYDVAGCAVTDDTIQNARGYNEVMGIALWDRFGEDVIKKARDKAMESIRRSIREREEK